MNNDPLTNVEYDLQVLLKSLDALRAEVLGLPGAREFALVVTKVEEAEMWLAKAKALYQTATS